MPKEVNPLAVYSKYSPNNSSEEQYVKTGLLAFDLLNAGRGLPRRRMLHFWAENGRGKTTAILTLARALIRKGEGVVFLAIEPSEKLCEDMGLRQNGVDIPGFIYVDMYTYDQLQEVTDAFMADNNKWMIIDSLTAVTPSQKLMKEKGIEDVTIGLDARIQSVYLRLYHGMIKQYDKTIIYITQARTKIGTGFGQKTELVGAGGEAVKFYSDMRFLILGQARVESSELGQDKGHTAAYKGYFVAEKTRHAAPLVRIPVTIVFGRGLSNIQSMKDYLNWRGLLVQKGSFFNTSLGGKEESIQGRSAMLDWVKENQTAIMEDFYTRAEEYYGWLQATNGGKTGSEGDD